MAKDKNIQSVKINSLADIQRVLSEFSPSSSSSKPLPSVKISPRISTTNSEDQQIVVRVDADTVPKSKRQILLEGFEVLRKKKDQIQKCADSMLPILVNGKDMVPQFPLQDSSRLPIDPLIGQWLGGYREGEFIYWSLPTGKYKYDIFSHKLFGPINEKPESTTSSV